MCSAPLTLKLKSASQKTEVLFLYLKIFYKEVRFMPTKKKEVTPEEVTNSQTDAEVTEALAAAK